MEFIGTLITYLMMACCVAGGISSLSMTSRSWAGPFRTACTPWRTCSSPFAG